MATDSHIPFVVFPLVELFTDVSPARLFKKGRHTSTDTCKTIDSVLSEAKKGCQGVRGLWLATDYDDAPKKDHNTIHERTEFPIDKGYKSPFAGKKVEDVVEWLKQKPEDVDLNEHFFAILDKTAEGGEIVVCRIGGKDLKDPDDLDYIRFDVSTGVATMRGGPPAWWEEAKENRGKAEIKY